MHLGEIKMCAFNFAPQGYALCDGRQLSVDRHRRLFELLGTSHGGDGVHSFCVPDLRGRAPMHVGGEPAPGIALGERKDGQTSLPPFIAPNHIIALDDGGHRADAFFGEVRLTAGARAPEGWLICQGQHLPIRNFAPLFALLGVTYGGDGVSTFRLPNLTPYLGHTFIIAHTGVYPNKGE